LAKVAHSPNLLATVAGIIVEIKPRPRLAIRRAESREQRAWGRELRAESKELGTWLLLYFSLPNELHLSFK